MELADIGHTETERCVLRQFREDDLEAFYAYAKDPEVGPRAGWKPHSALSDTKRILDSFITGAEVLAITLKGEDKVIGSVGLHTDSKRAFPKTSRMLGYVLGRDYWGRGIMTECASAVIKLGFEKMGLNVISVSHFTFNDASRRVIEKCGFKYEGTLRCAYPAVEGYSEYGDVYDEACYSILRNEYYGGQL